MSKDVGSNQVSCDSERTMSGDKDVSTDIGDVPEDPLGEDNGAAFILFLTVT